MAKSAGTPEPVPESGALECPHCKSSRVIKDHNSGRLVCSNCGYVIEEKSFDRGPEWRAFDQEGWEKKSRAGPPRTETIHDRGLSTQIDYRNRDARGKNLSPEKGAQMYRMRKWHKRGKVEDAKDRNLTIALSELDRLSSQLGLPRSVEEGAAKIYREAVEERMIRGRSIESMISAVVYIECRRENIPRTLAEIAEVSSADAKKIGHNQKFIEKNLDVDSGVADPPALVSRFGSRLNLSGKTCGKAVDLIRQAQRKKITSGRSPRGIAAAAIYMACCMSEDDRRTQGEVAEAAGVTEVTVRNRYKDLERELGVSVEVGVGKRPSKHKETLQEKEKAGKEEPKVKGAVRNIQVKNIKCENVVSSVTFKDTKFDLEKLVKKLDANKPGDFPGVSYALEGTEATFLIFRSGKANCVGTSSVSEAKKAPKLLAKKLEEEGFEVDPDPEVEIRNIISRAVFNVTVDLESLHRSPYDTSYDPTSFPGLQLELDEPDVDFLLFASGQAVLHSKSKGDIGSALDRTCEILREFATGSVVDGKTKEAIAWLEKKPRFTDLLKFVRDGPKGYVQIAEELGVKEMTARQYVYECSGKEIVKREKGDGGIEVEITERGKEALDAVA